MKINQLFCKHIWKIDNHEHLGYVLRSYLGVVLYRQERVGLFLHCLKCGKTKIEETRMPEEELHSWEKIDE